MITSKEISIQPDTSGTMVRLEMSYEQDGKPQMIGMVMDAHDLDNVITNLAVARAKLSPPHPAQLDPKPVFRNVTRNTAVIIFRPHLVSKEITVAILHPGFGWLAFPMEVKAAVKLGSMIAKTAVDASGQSIVGPDGKPL